MKIHCINCGHSLFLGDAYTDYSGPIRCSTCRSSLEIETRDGKIRSIRPMAQKPQQQAEGKPRADEG